MANDAIQKYGKENIDIYGVSCGGNRAMCNKFDIDGYPSVFVIPKDAAVSNWKEIPSVSGFHVRMIEKTLAEAEKQMKNKSKGSQKTTVGATKRAETKRDLARNVGNIVKQTNIPPPNQKAGAAAALKKESALDRYNRFHKSSISQIANKKTPVRRRPTLISNKSKTDKEPSPTPIQESSKAPGKTVIQVSSKTSEKTMAPKQTQPTQAMKAHRIGTEEHKKRMESVRRIVEAKAPNKKRSMEQVEKGEVPFKVLPAAEKAISRIPILKHFHSLSDEEELILDASLSFVESFRVSVFKRNGPLNSSEKKALQNWLHFVSIALPQEWGKCHQSSTKKYSFSCFQRNSRSDERSCVQFRPHYGKLRKFDGGSRPSSSSSGYVE